VQQAIGEDMAALAVAAQLRLVDGDEGETSRAGIASTVHSFQRGPGGSIRSSPVISATFSRP
jgi:hypothetical protein